MIVDYEPITSVYCTVPSDLGQLSVDSYISGIIAGVLEGAGFPARVTAHSVAIEEGEVYNSAGGGTASGGKTVGGNGGNMGLLPRKDKAVFLVKFSPEVLEKDAALER